MPIYPPAHSRALARIWIAEYLLNVAVRSELVRGQLLDTESRGQKAPHPWYGVKGQGASPPIMYTGQVTSTEGDT